MHINLILLFLSPSILALLTLPFIPSRRIANNWSAVLATLSFFAAIPLLVQHYHHNHSTSITLLYPWLVCDSLSVFLLGLTSFVAMLTSWYAVDYLAHEKHSLLHRLIYRFYNTTFHLFNLSIFIALLSNNIGLMWIAIELATICSVMLVALYQTPEALEAAWKYLMLCGVGIGLALLGTVILYFAAYPYLSSEQGLLWSSLLKIAPHLSPTLLAIAFIFLFVGYGTKAGFFPLHNWLPDAYTEASPMAAVLSALLSNTAFIAIVRFKLLLMQTTLQAFSCQLFLTIGCISLVFAALALLRQQKLQRLFAYSSIEQMGLATIAFGLGTPLGYTVGLAQLGFSTLLKSVLFFL